MSNLTLSPVDFLAYSPYLAASTTQHASSVANSEIYASRAEAKAIVSVHSSQNIGIADYIHLNNLCLQQQQIMSDAVVGAFNLYLNLVFSPSHISQHDLAHLSSAISHNFNISNQINALSHHVGSGTPELQHLALLSVQENSDAKKLQVAFEKFKHAFESAPHPIDPHLQVTLRNQFFTVWHLAVQESELANQIYDTAARLPIAEVSEYAASQFAYQADTPVLPEATQTLLNSRVVSSAFRL